MEWSKFDLSLLSNHRNRIISVALALTVVLYLAWQWKTISSPHLPSASADVLAILTRTPLGQEDLDWTDEGDTPVSRPAVLGTPAYAIAFDDSTITDVMTGKPIEGVNEEGHTFNLAVLKLPKGSKWDYVGVARGPTRKTDWLQVVGFPARQQVLVAMGLKLGKDGALEVVGPGQTLDIPVFFQGGCQELGFWMATWGPEDPRLFWTDAGTPGLTFERTVSDSGHCRGLGFLPDLRAIYPALDAALKPVHGAQPYSPSKLPGQATNMELIKSDGQDFIEKNWVSFYPGPVADSQALHPHIMYKVAPAIALEPTTVSLRSITYKPFHNPHAETVGCISRLHPWLDEWHIHQATAFHRLTLCKRGCIPDEHNTVLITLGHLERKPRYAKFFATFNVLPPHEPISVGPIFVISKCPPLAQLTPRTADHLAAGTDDIAEINYVLAFSPVTAHDLDRRTPYVPPPPGVLDDHFFIDDHMLLTLGKNDNVMMSSVVSVEEAIGRQKLCL